MLKASTWKVFSRTCPNRTVAVEPRSEVPYRKYRNTTTVRLNNQYLVPFVDSFIFFFKRSPLRRIFLRQFFMNIIFFVNFFVSLFGFLFSLIHMLFCRMTIPILSYALLPSTMCNLGPSQTCRTGDKVKPRIECDLKFET